MRAESGAAASGNAFFVALIHVGQVEARALSDG